VPKTYSHEEPDDYVSKLVDQGVTFCVQVVQQADCEHRLPHATTFLLSLSQAQWTQLAATQMFDSRPTDPLFLSPDFIDTLDNLQSQLLLESKLWSVPRRSLFKSTDIGLQQVGIKEHRNAQLFRRMQRNDKPVYKLIQETPEFLANLISS
jgi:hypothetical protein